MSTFLGAELRLRAGGGRLTSLTLVTAGQPPQDTKYGYLLGLGKCSDPKT